MNDTENQRFNVNESFISENAEIFIMIDFKNNAEMFVKIMKSVTF